MNLLVVSASAPPKNSSESIQVGKYLKYLTRTHQVTLLTTAAQGGWEPEDPSLNVYLKNLEAMVRIPMPSLRWISIFKKISSRILIPDESAPFIWQHSKAINKVKKPDIIISRSAPFSSALLADKLSQSWNVPWMMHLSDVWADNPFLKVNDYVKKRQSQLEKQCIERASLVTLTSQATLDFYSEKYPASKSKFLLLPNVFDEDDINLIKPDFTQKCRFVFTGRLYGSRSLHTFMDAVEKAAQLNSAFEELTEFIFAGFFDDENIRRVQTSPLSNVKYMGALSMQKAIELQQHSHILVTIDSLDEDPIFKSFFPSKLLDYLASRRKIIAITTKGSATFTTVHGKSGFCFDRSDLEKLPQQLNDVVEKFRSGDENYFINSSNFNEYSASANTARLNEWLEQLKKSNG